MFYVIFNRVGVDDNHVIKVNVHKDANIWAEYMVHEQLVSCTSIIIPNLHYVADHCTVRCREQCARDMLLFHTNLLMDILAIKQSAKLVR